MFTQNESNETRVMVIVFRFMVFIILYCRFVYRALFPKLSMRSIYMVKTLSRPKLIIIHLIHGLYASVSDFEHYLSFDISNKFQTQNENLNRHYQTHEIVNITKTARNTLLYCAPFVTLILIGSRNKICNF